MYYYLRGCGPVPEGPKDPLRRDVVVKWDHEPAVDLPGGGAAGVLHPSAREEAFEEGK